MTSEVIWILLLSAGLALGQTTTTQKSSRTTTIDLSQTTTTTHTTEATELPTDKVLFVAGGTINDEPNTGFAATEAIHLATDDLLDYTCENPANLPTASFQCPLSFKASVVKIFVFFLPGIIFYL